MTSIDQFATQWLRWAFAATWQVGLLVCLIAVLTYLLRGASARLRYGLWLLVLLKIFLPTTLSVSWGVGHWGVAPIAALTKTTNDTVPASPDTAAGINQALGERVAAALSGRSQSFSLTAAMLVIWAMGCVALWLAVAWRYWRLTQTTNSMRQIDEGPVRIEIERLAEQFAIRTAPAVYATEQSISPMLIGVVSPKIVLPESFLSRLTADELQMILAHELVHWRRRDTWVGWLQVFVQGLFWFHPLVWFANARIRHERECACDETVLREARCDRDGYGETIIRVLAAARGRSLVMANMAGIFERGSLLQIRLEEIMSFDPNKRRFGWLSQALLIAVALVLLPMATTRVQADKPAGTTAITAKESGDAVKKEKNKLAKTNWPTIVETSPKIGATEVDPATTEISVKFDRDMGGGMSWTGGGPDFPTSPEGSKATWKDKRTCVLPVQLKGASYYRVGINSTSYQNFKSEQGVPAETAAIYFTTAGAKPPVTIRVRTPKVAKSVPENGAKDVKPALKMLSVTFDMPMSTDGFSFTGGEPTFPGTEEGKPNWSKDGRTCSLPVALEAGKKYELGLNSFSHKNFSSKWGVPLEPVHFTFTTEGYKDDAAGTSADTAEESK